MTSFRGLQFQAISKAIAITMVALLSLTAHHHVSAFMSTSTRTHSTHSSSSSISSSINRSSSTFTPSTALFVTSKESQQQQQQEQQPDYGKTSIEIDTHKLEKKKRKKQEEQKKEWRRPELFGQSLVQQTVDEMSSNVEFQQTEQRLQSIGQVGMTKEERTKRRRALDLIGVPSFNQFLYSKTKESEASKAETKVGAEAEAEADQTKELILNRKQTEVLQLNVGLYCNQACAHCHVESSPLRQEMMSNEVAAKCIQLLKDTPSVHTLDITGGAPELNSNFRYIVSMARELSSHDGNGNGDTGRKLDIIDRCNLTVLQEPGQEDLIPFLVKNNVHIVASLPCYSEDNVNKQRGNGVFDRSISGLIALNDAGYGKPENPHLKLDLVYNPLGAFLPPPQESLEEQYKKQLDENFGIYFNSLFTMTNMPVKRFTDFLYNRGELDDYMDLLVRNYNHDTVEKLMCRNTISVGYDGKIFDCDFNQQLGYTIGSGSGSGNGSNSGSTSDSSDSDKKELLFNNNGKTVFDIKTLDELSCDVITNDNHCFGCTAGMGSS